MKTVLKGNSAVARAVKMVRPKVICAYPITPQTSIIEELADMVATGQLEARFMKVESEHSAMAGCIGAASVGARVFTATSSHGLAYMHEMLHWAAAARLPIVMVNCNRALGPGWNLFADHTDSLSQRDTGWMQIYCASAQEVFDTVVQAYEVSQRTLLPSMVMLDAFFLSHTYEDIDLPEQDVVDRFLSPFELPHRIDLARPTLVSPVTDEDHYMEFRRKIAVAHEHALSEWHKADRRWQAMTGRGYGLIEEYHNRDAEIVFVASSTNCAYCACCHRPPSRPRHPRRPGQVAGFQAVPGGGLAQRFVRKETGDCAGPRLLVWTPRDLSPGDQVCPIRRSRGSSSSGSSSQRRNCRFGRSRCYSGRY